MGKCMSSGGNANAGSSVDDKNGTDEKKKEQIDVHKKYQFRRTLGKGASCRVVEAIDKENKEKKLAIKIMSKEKPICQTLYKHEVDILSRIEHQNIVEYIDSTEDDSNYYVLTGLCEGGELFDRIVNPEYKITEKVAAALIHDMLESIKYLHEKNIVHRDLKPENFVFESTATDANIILIDFGCAKVVNDDKEYKDLVGTVYYLAPELAAQSSRVHKTGKVLKCSDIWSIGVIAYVMLTGRPPFKGRTNKDIFTHIIKDQLKFPSDVELSDGFKDFVRKALVKNPYKRISIDEALRHPWVQGKAAAEIQLNKDVIRYLRQFNYQSKLKKAITRCLAKNMSSEPEKEVKRHFTRLDKDGDGFLDENELQYLLLDMGFAPNKAKTEAKLMLEAADENKDGQVDFNEFKQVWHRKLLSQHDQYIHRVFAVFDDNGDGFIDAKELQGVLGDDFEQIQKMIEEVDENGDGKLSFEEFQKAMQEETNSQKLEAYANLGGEQLNESDRVDVEIEDGDDQKEEQD